LSKVPELTRPNGGGQYECFGICEAMGLSGYSAIGSRCQGKLIMIDFSKIPLDDPKVYKQFSLGNTIGVFQFSGHGMSDFLRKSNPKEFNDLVVANALYRPGTLRSGMVDILIERKNGKKYETDERLKWILDETYGIMIFQEQIMQVAITSAGFSHEQADKLRKVIAKSRGKIEIEKFKGNFIDWSVANGFKGDQLWNEIVEFAGYGFNKSHSFAYAKIAYWTMWLKVHYPKEYMLSLLTFSSNDNIKKHVEEAKRLGFYISTPKTGFSKAEKWVEKNGVFYAPYNTIKSIREEVAFEAEKIRRIGFFKTSAKTKSQQLLRDAGCYSKTCNLDLFNFEPSRPKKKEVDYKEKYPNLFKICPEFFNVDLDDILKANFPGELTSPPEKPKFIKRIKLKNNEINCDQCNLKAEKQKKTTKGKYNVFVIGEKPNIDIKEFWMELKKYGLYKKHFHVSSILRCPCEDPSKSQIGVCSQKVVEEIKQTKCRLAVVIGNIGYQVFSGKRGMISGKCQWIEKYGLWIVFCSLPFDVFNGKENFQKGVNKFIEIFEKML
jgi:hypothetical protein